MLYQLKNEKLTVTIEDKGAQLRSVKSADGAEYLWQGDEKIWAAQAPNLFPHIARLTTGRYTLEGKTYEMKSHGFAKDTVFAAEQENDAHILFTIKADASTLAQYPYQFTFGVDYRLEGGKLLITYVVENKDEKTMYFGVGGHPGFNVPLERGLDFEDYYLEFDCEKAALLVGMSEDCYVQGENVKFPLEEGKKLALRHSCFDHDAIILTQMCRAVTLKSDKNGRAVKLCYPDMEYLGIWHRPFTEAPYVCIEPWTSLPARKDIVEDFSTQPTLLSLEAGKRYSNTYSIEIF